MFKTCMGGIALSLAFGLTLSARGGATYWKETIPVQLRPAP
jgi:hypothetical protein